MYLICIYNAIPIAISLILNTLFFTISKSFSNLKNNDLLTLNLNTLLLSKEIVTALNFSILIFDKVLYELCLSCIRIRLYIVVSIVESVEIYNIAKEHTILESILLNLILKQYIRNLFMVPMHNKPTSYKTLHL